MKVLRKSDRVKFTVEGVEFVIAPLSYRDRIELSSLVRHVSGEVKLDWIEQTFVMIKRCLKEVRGMKDHDDKDYQLTFDENGELETECANEILSCLKSSPATNAIIHTAMGNMEPNEGVEFSVLGK